MEAREVEGRPPSEWEAEAKATTESSTSQKVFFCREANALEALSQVHSQGSPSRSSASASFLLLLRLSLSEEEPFLRFLEAEPFFPPGSEGPPKEPFLKTNTPYRRTKK